MKKTSSLLLVVLLLFTLSGAASADDSPYCLTISNIDVNISSNNQHHTLAFQGLELVFAPIVSEDDHVLALNILGNGSLLLSATCKLVDGKVYFAVDGLSNIYCVSASAGSSALRILDQFLPSIGKVASDENEAESSQIDTAIHFSFDPASSHVLIEFSQDRMSCAFGASLQLSNHDLTICPIDNLSNALDIQDLTDEQISSLKSELMFTSGKLIAFVTPALITFRFPGLFAGYSNISPTKKAA